MKINIGPYPRWFGPYQIAEKILFWKDKDDGAVFALGEWLDKHTPITEISAYFFNKRKVEIRIDPYDTWSMDDTDYSSHVKATQGNQAWFTRRGR